MIPLNEITDVNSAELGLIIGRSSPLDYIKSIVPTLNGFDLLETKRAINALYNADKENIDQMAYTVQLVAETTWDLSDPDMEEIYQLAVNCHSRFKKLFQ